MSGHCIERCFKLHGYPPGFKPIQPRRYAAYAAQEDCTEIVQSDNGSETHTAPNITVDQYNHLLSMLSVSQKEQDNSYSGNKSDIGCSGLFAHCLLSPHIHLMMIGSWSGASDHIMP